VSRPAGAGFGGHYRNPKLSLSLVAVSRADGLRTARLPPSQLAERRVKTAFKNSAAAILPPRNSKLKQVVHVAVIDHPTPT
jgi:hypothetical protein